MTGLAGPAPSASRRVHGIGVIAVEQIGAARKRRQIFRFDTIDDHEHGCTIRVLVLMREPDRLCDRVALALLAMRQKGSFFIGPQEDIEMLDAFGRTCPDQDPMTLRPYALDKLG